MEDAFAGHHKKTVIAQQVRSGRGSSLGGQVAGSILRSFVTGCNNCVVSRTSRKACVTAACSEGLCVGKHEARPLDGGKKKSNIP